MAQGGIEAHNRYKTEVYSYPGCICDQHNKTHNITMKTNSYYGNIMYSIHFTGFQKTQAL